MAYVVVVFVTSILIHLLGGINAGPRNSYGPWPGPGVRVLHGVFVIDRPGVHPSKALRQAEGRRIGFLEDVGIRPEIGSLEDQRIALPMAARITQPLVKVFAYVWVPVERDDSGAVDHLRSDDHVAGTLYDLKVVVVDDRHVGRHVGPNDTAYRQVEIQVRVRHAGVESGQGGGALVMFLLPLG